MKRNETLTKVLRLIVLAFTVILVGMIATACRGAQGTPSPTPTPNPTPTFTPTPTAIPTPTPEPTATHTPTPIPTVSPEEFKEQLSHALAGEWDEVSFENELVGYKIDNLQFVLLPDVPLKEWNAENFLWEKERQKIASLVSLQEGQIARFNKQGMTEIYDSQENLLGVLDPDISWSLSPLEDDLIHQGEDLMVRVKLDPQADERPIVEAFRPEDQKLIKSSLPQILQDVQLPEGTSLLAVVDGKYWEPESRKLAEEWRWVIPQREVVIWKPGEPVEPVIEAIQRGGEPTPTPEPETWTYIEGVEHVKFAEFNQEQLQMLKEAAELVKKYDPERFALFEREIDWVKLYDGEISHYHWGGTIEVATNHFQSPLPLPLGHPLADLSWNRETLVFILAGTIWGHEFQHHIQHVEGRDFARTCPTAGIRVSENEAGKAEVDLMKKIRQGISEGNLWEVDRMISHLEPSDKDCAW